MTTSSSPVPPELQSKIALWRSKSADGTITLDEMKQAILALRSGRQSAAVAAAGSKTKSKAPARSADDLLSELGGI